MRYNPGSWIMRICNCFAFKRNKTPKTSNLFKTSLLLCFKMQHVVQTVTFNLFFFPNFVDEVWMGRWLSLEIFSMISLAGSSSDPALSSGLSDDIFSNNLDFALSDLALLSLFKGLRQLLSLQASSRVSRGKCNGVSSPSWNLSWSREGSLFVSLSSYADDAKESLNDVSCRVWSAVDSEIWLTDHFSLWLCCLIRLKESSAFWWLIFPWSWSATHSSGRWFLELSICGWSRVDPTDISDFADPDSDESEILVPGNCPDSNASAPANSTFLNWSHLWTGRKLAGAECLRWSSCLSSWGTIASSIKLICRTVLG